MISTYKAKLSLLTAQIVICGLFAGNGPSREVKRPHEVKWQHRRRVLYTKYAGTENSKCRSWILVTRSGGCYGRTPRMSNLVPLLGADETLNIARPTNGGVCAYISGKSYDL